MSKNYFEDKKQQILNYCNQLKMDHLEYDNKIIELKSCVKNVWIITKIGTSRTLKDIDGIKVKEITVKSLISLYVQRLEKNLDLNELQQAMEKIENL